MNLVTLKTAQLPKPQRYPNLAEMRRLRSQEKLFIQRKRDGQRHVILITEQGAMILDRSYRHIQHFDALEATFNGFQLPVGTLIDGEIVIDLENEGDDFSTISSLNKAGLAKARGIVARLARAPRFMIFDILYCGEQPTFNLPFEVRYNTIKTAFEGKHQLVYIAENLDGTVDECMQLAIQNGWEGLIFWHKEQSTKLGYGKTVPRLNCWKWKNTKEEDFVCTGFEYTKAEATGEMIGVVGALNIAEYRNGKLVSVGGVGTGLTLAERREALTWSFPCVVEVVYDERTPSGAVRFPRFVRKRGDKTVEEVRLEARVRTNYDKGDKQYAPRGHKAA